MRVQCQYVVACDGAGSGLRRAAGIGLRGEPRLQQLVSIHFRSPALGHALLQRGRPAMLYFVFNPDVIAVLVAHSLEAGEFVAQVPFFPPAQAPEDFTPQGEWGCRSVSACCVRQLARRQVPPSPWRWCRCAPGP